MKKLINKILGMFAILVIISVTFVHAQELDDQGKLKGRWDFIFKCGKCHSLERPLSKRKSPDQWRDTIKTMHARSHGWIEDKQVDEIIYFLSLKSLFETKCSNCHSKDRALDEIKTKEGWTKTVKSMQKKKQVWITKEEADQIILYLFTIQGGE